MWKTYQRIHKSIDVVSFFCTQQWKFNNDNMQNLWKKMSPQDKHLFNFDITLVEWKEAIFAAIRGLRIYVMENPSLGVEEEVTRHKRCVHL
jgi:fatty acyl-CoA reductase